MDFQQNENILKKFYESHGITNHFVSDVKYLRKAFMEINSMWLEQYNAIDKINFLVIGEAPLWGETKKYIYNRQTTNTQFFYRSDIEHLTKSILTDKSAFLRACLDLGFIFIDVSPFPLNPVNTQINYRTMKLKDYQDLVKETLDTFLKPKLKKVKSKSTSRLKIAYRYKRVEKSFSGLLNPLFLELGLVSDEKSISDIAMSGGGVDRTKLSKLVT